MLVKPEQHRAIGDAELLRDVAGAATQIDVFALKPLAIPEGLGRTPMRPFEKLSLLVALYHTILYHVRSRDYATTREFGQYQGALGFGQVGTQYHDVR